MAVHVLPRLMFHFSREKLFALPVGWKGAGVSLFPLLDTRQFETELKANPDAEVEMGIKAYELKAVGAMDGKAVVSGIMVQG